MQRKRLFVPFSSIQTLVSKDTHIVSVFVPTVQFSVAQAQHGQRPLYEFHPSWGQIHWEIQESFSFPAFHTQKTHFQNVFLGRLRWLLQFRGSMRSLTGYIYTCVCACGRTVLLEKKMLPNISFYFK